MIIYGEILREFQKQRVKYIIVGGIAVNLLGSLRSTANIDMLVEMSDENLVKIVRILKDKGYRLKQPLDPMGIANSKIRQDWVKNKHMKAFNFYKESGLKEVDIVVESPVSYEQAKEDVVLIKVNNITLPVISIDKLIEMKRNAGRDLDKLDIGELKRIKRLKRQR